MVAKLCLLVPLASGEDVRQILIDQDCLDRAFTPRRIGDELALPVHEGFLFDAIDFEHRLEQVDVEPAPPAIDPHSRLYNAIASLPVQAKLLGMFSSWTGVLPDLSDSR